MAHQTCDWELHDGWWLFVIGPETPSMAEYEEAMAEKARILTAGPLRGSLVFSEGGQPDAVQRDKLLSVHAIRPGFKSVMVTRSKEAAHVITILRWFDQGIKLKEEVSAAMDELGVPEPERKGLSRALTRLRSQLMAARGQGSGEQHLG